MSSESRGEARILANEDLKEMPLHELQAALHLTQQQLALTLAMTQAAFRKWRNARMFTSVPSGISLRLWADGWKCTRSFPMGK